MSQELDLRVNRLPAPTWNWLQMNDVRLSGVSVDREGKIETETPGSVRAGLAKREETPFDFDNLETGMGPDLDRLMQEDCETARIWTTTAGAAEAAPLRLHLSYASGEKAYNRIGICAEEGSTLTVIQDIRQMGNGAEERENGGLAALQTKIRARKNAHVRLVQIQNLADRFTFLNDVGISCEDGSQIETIQLVLGGGETYTGLRCALEGAGSALQSRIGYLLEEKGTLDVNYVAYHTGARTVSSMDVSGVLKDQSSKLFRGTIDFRHGSEGAKGDEKEDVLLLSDEAVNRTIPLILCEEEDVEGNHGATIGRLDEELLFYLASRGIEEEAACQLMARARMDAVCREIRDEEAEKLVQTYLDKGEGEHDDEE